MSHRENDILKLSTKRIQETYFDQRVGELAEGLRIIRPSATSTMCSLTISTGNKIILV